MSEPTKSQDKTINKTSVGDNVLFGPASTIAANGKDSST
jgi:hypothetical protein